MHFETTYKLEDFILNTRWEELPDAVQTRMKGCFVDLMGALLIGSRSDQFKVGVKLAHTLYGSGKIPVVGTADRFNFMGASAAMGHSSNAYDIDDGHNLIRAHPGTSFVGALLAAACEKGLSRNEFLAAMVVAYETTIRSGAAIMDYYQYAHSSGTFGAVGTAAGVGRIYGFTREQMNHVLSVAEFNAPLVPGIRSVEYPSMNKDGVPFGVMIGALAVMEVLSGFEGNKNLLEADEYAHYLDDLGQKWEVMNLYFKPYTCCRWAHPVIDACIGLMREHKLVPADVKHVSVKTFHRATLLSKIVPATVDEAQYNIAYPVAAALVYGDFGYAQVRQESLGDPVVVAMMDKLSFETDEALDRQFPARRICRVVLTTVDGRVFESPECEPRGEACENIGLDWLCDKFERIAGPVTDAESRAKLVSMMTGDEDVPVQAIVEEANRGLGL
ncbi:MAG: MmgE/PrpD family protein [Ruminococcaceae bacterium]|nr:MmgE/PrpD family protein [Oscillospiraceae bacterium]